MYKREEKTPNHVGLPAAAVVPNTTATETLIMLFFSLYFTLINIISQLHNILYNKFFNFIAHFNLAYNLNSKMQPCTQEIKLL